MVRLVNTVTGAHGCYDLVYMEFRGKAKTVAREFRAPLCQNWMVRSEKMGLRNPC